LSVIVSILVTAAKAAKNIDADDPKLKMQTLDDANNQ
jgi:hypothetical protein